VFCFAQSENTPTPVHQCHTYLLTYYATGTRVPDKLPDRVYSSNELPDNGTPNTNTNPNPNLNQTLTSFNF